MTLRLAIFVSLLILFGILESLLPKRTLIQNRPKRWINNLILSGINSLSIRLVFPAGAIGAALIASKSGLGLFHLFKVPYILQIILAVAFLDFVIYLQHIVFHKIPILWNIHRVHHTDLELDASSGIRFHFVEIVLSMGIKYGAIMLIGAPAEAVLIFEILLNSTALFNHSNLNIPEKLDTLIRLAIVTPDMHRVHHSVIKTETDSNYGFNFPWWDRLFKTYNRDPKKGHKAMTIGISEYQTEAPQSLPWLLKLPFVK